MRMSRFLVPALLLAAGSSVFFSQPSAAQPAGQPPPPARGQQPGGGGGGGGGARGEGPTTAEQAMKLMNRSVQRLERQVADASKKDDNLRLVNEAQRGCIIAKGLVPKGPWSEEPDAAKKAAALAPYRRDLIAVARKLLDLEAAIMDDKAEDARKTITEIKKLKEEGHKEMGVKDD